jgi:hypothetical protein
LTYANVEIDPDSTRENIENNDIEKVESVVYELDVPFEEQKCMATWCFLPDMDKLR